MIFSYQVKYCLSFVEGEVFIEEETFNTNTNLEKTLLISYQLQAWLSLLILSKIIIIMSAQHSSQFISHINYKQLHITDMLKLKTCMTSPSSSKELDLTNFADLSNLCFMVFNAEDESRSLRKVMTQEDWPD